MDQVLHGADGAGDHVRLDFKPLAGHATGVLNAVYTINPVPSRLRVNHPATGRYGQRLGGNDGTLHVLSLHLGAIPMERRHTTAVLRLYLSTRDTDVSGSHVAVAQLLQLGDGGGDAFGRSGHVGHGAAPHPARGAETGPEDDDRTCLGDLTE